MQIFDRLRETRPEAFKKVTAISTDFGSDDLNISDEFKAIIRQEVQVNCQFKFQIDFKTSSNITKTLMWKLTH